MEYGAITVFQERMSPRNKESIAEKCPDDILECPEASKLDFWLSRFVVEVHWTDSQPYPPKSVHQLLHYTCHYCQFALTLPAEVADYARAT